MTNEELIAYLNQEFPDAQVKQGIQYVEMTVAPEQLHATAQSLKTNAASAFDFLFCLTGVDYPDCMGIVYHLESIAHRHTMVLKVKSIDRTDVAFDTVSDVWHTAKSHEREAYDLLGIRFNHHTDLRRLFLEDGWGFPLRKDYVDEVHIVER